VGAGEQTRAAALDHGLAYRQVRAAAVAALLMTLAALAAVDLAAWVKGLLMGRPGEAFAGYYAAALVGRAHGWASLYEGNLYAAALQALIHSRDVFGNLPLAAWAALPFTLLPFHTANLLWSLLLAAGFVWTWQAATSGPLWKRALLLLVGLESFPVFFALHLGQLALLVAALLVLHWRLLRAGHPALAGIALGLAFIKPQNVALLPLVVLLSGRWKTAAACAATVGVLAAAIAIALGADGLRALYSTLQADSLACQDCTRQTLAAHLPGWVPQLPVRAVIALVAVVPAVAAGGRRYERALLAGVLGAFLVTPYAHPEDLTLLFVCAWLVLRAGASDLMRPSLWLGYPFVAFENLTGPVPLLLVELALLAVLTWDALALRGAADPRAAIRGSTNRVLGGGRGTLPREGGGVSDPAGRMLRPDDDVDAPEVSIVVPALDEERTIGEFVDWCREGLRRVGLHGEILIVSSSTDRTNEIALTHGARVLSTPRLGLGRAYIDATPHIRGKYVLVGDADCTYDFREIGPFIEKLRDGYDLVMGSRFRGTIEPRAMPAHHRYFGTPITNWIFNLVVGSRFSDIHCGMRGLTRETYLEIGLTSQGWEYASEMILKSLHLKLRVTEVPISFYRDRNGRVSTVKRRGWLTPWKAGWESLRIMFTFGADFFLYRPGWFLAVLGLAAVALMTPGPIAIGPIRLATNTQFLAVAISIIGVSAVYLGILAKVINDLTGISTSRWTSRFSYNRTFIISTVVTLTGVASETVLLAVYVGNGLSLPPGATPFVHLAISGMLLVMLGLLTFAFMLVLHALAARLTRPSSGG
jgi:hypothetical protein